MLITKKRALVLVTGSFVGFLLGMSLVTLIRAAPTQPVSQTTAVPANPAPTLTPTLTTTQTMTRYLPLLLTLPSPNPLPPPVPLSSTPPIDFDAVQIDLRQQGLNLAYNKIGFHTGIGGNTDGLLDWMTQLDAAGVPVFLKSADNAEPLYQAQQLRLQSGVPHTLVFRRTGAAYDIPNYDLPPQQAAQEHWQLHKAAWPPELDPNLVWIETVNEVDKNRSAWLGEFALETARLALADGYRWAAFGWSSGEPEPEHWQSPEMLAFLNVVGNHPDRLAIALHEYSFEADDIKRWYPYLVGRFQRLFQICDDHNIKRPTILITEWGWEHDHVPTPETAVQDVQWAAWLYAAYPQVKGAAIWYLGGGFGGIADEAQLLIAPMRDYSLSHYFGYTPGQGAVEPGLFADIVHLE